jgi:hypothetical protein
MYKPGLDVTGSCLGIVGLVLLNVAWNNGPLFGWNQPSVYGLLVVGVLALFAFFWVEMHVASPLLPVKAMNATVAWTLTLLAFGWGSFGIWLWFAHPQSVLMNDFCILTQTTGTAGGSYSKFAAKIHSRLPPSTHRR